VPERASAADWLAVAAGTIGSLMALVDVSIVNASLPVIQGEIGATPSEGTWVGTSYMIAEIVAIPLTAWLQRMLGMRLLLLAGSTIFAGFSVACGLADSLGAMIFGRIGQGLAGGVLIPTALTIVAMRLPPRQQALGLAMTAIAALLGPIAGPLLGGWLTENLSWHFAFFINAPVSLLQVAMVLIAFPRAPADWRQLREADWLGIVGIVIGLGALTTLLEEGHREHWFDSPLIWRLAAASAFGFTLLAIGQLRAPVPVLRLALLRDRSIGSSILLMGVVGLLLYSTLFITPQFLAAVAGYTAMQSGQVAFLSGLVAIPAALTYPLLVRVMGSRMIVGGAILCIAIATWLASGLTADADGAQFTVTQLLYGIGTTLSAIPLQQTVMSAIPAAEAAQGNSLMSVSRNLGGSIGLAAIASFQEVRFDFHHWSLNGAIAANDPEAGVRLAQAALAFGGGPEGLDAALRALDGQVMLQALVMTFNDMYFVMALIGLLVVPAVLMLSPVRADGSSASALSH